MPLLPALQAFLVALDGPRTPPGQPPAPVQQPPAAPAGPLGPILEAHAVRLAQLEASVSAFEGLIKTEVDRGIKATEATRRAVQRVAQRLESSLEGAPGDEDDDVRNADGGGSEGRWVQPVPARVEVPQPAFTLDDHFAVARRAAAMMD